MAHELMTTAEVADYLRLKERKVYDLLSKEEIPAYRVAGKWLFPRTLIDAWLAESRSGPQVTQAPAPPIVTGSFDPLLDWALRRSNCGLALLAAPSLSGLDRLIAREALVAGIHVFDPKTESFNIHAVASRPGLHDAVVIEWAWREQGLVVAPGNPLGLGGVSDMRRTGLRVARRPDEAGAHILFQSLLRKAGIDMREVRFVEDVSLTQTDLAGDIMDGRADCGMAIRAVAERHRLGFVPLARERFDLVIRRRDFFEPQVQALLAFTRDQAFVAEAESLKGYLVANTGRVRYNA